MREVENGVSKQLIVINTAQQSMVCFHGQELIHAFPISSAKNGLGETNGSECTPRGWHAVYSVIGREQVENSVFVGRRWTGEIYSPALARNFPGRDWILTRILQLDGLEFGKNKGGDVDSLSRYIYIHGTPDETDMRVPGSHGCIRMRNSDVIILADWVMLSTHVYIH